MEFKNLELALKEKSDNFDFASNSLDSIPISFSNCESFKEFDYLAKTEDLNTNKSILFDDKISWCSKINNNQFLKIKYCFNTLFKITYPEEFFKNILSNKYKTIVGSIKSSDIICFAVLNVDMIFKKVEILSFGVLKEFQGRHYGSRLMQKLLEEFKILGIKEISLVVQKTNKIAISLYEKFGFIVKKEDLNYYSVLQGEERKALIMKKSLATEQFWIFKVFKNIAKKFIF